MSNVIEKKYVVVKNVDYDEFVKSKESYTYYCKHYFTDVFNKASRTTVCFDGAYGSKVMYCENCNETHCNNMNINVELRNYSNNQKENEGDTDNFVSFRNTDKNLQAHITNVTCNKCGSVYNLEDVRIINHARFAHKSDIRLVYDKIYDDGDEFVKFSIKTCSMVVERAFYSVDNQYKIIFNTKTGQTYLYDNPANKKRKFKVIETKLALSNINLSARNIDFIFNRCLIDCENPHEYKLNKLKEIYNLIYKKISNNLGYKPKTIEEYAKEFDITDESEIYNFEILAIFNRFPNLNPFGFTKLSMYTTQYSILKKMRDIKNTCKEPLLELSNAYNVKYFDLFKKYFYSNDPAKLCWLIYFSMFFDSKDYLEKIIDKYRQYSDIADNPYDVDRLIKKRYSLTNSISLLFRDIRKTINEDNMYVLIDKFISDYKISSAIKSIANLYYIINKKINSKVKLDMQHIFNSLCRIFNEKDIESVLKDIEDYMYEELNKTSYSKNTNKFKFKLSTINEYRDSIESEEVKNNIMVSSIYNSIPHFNPYVLAEMLFGPKLHYSLAQQCKELEDFDIKDYIKDNKGDILGEFFKEFNIPNVKSLRNKMLKNPKLSPILAFYSHIFTDVNLLNNIVDSVASNEVFRYDLNDIKKYFSNDTDDNCRYCMLEYLHKLIEHLIMVQGETITAKKIVSAYSTGNYNYLFDIWPMYETHLELYPGEPVDLTGNIREIHDRLVGLTGGAARPFTAKDFKPFRYSKSEKELNSDIDGYSFRLAHNGRDLAILGNDLKNCVRGYVRRARSKDCYIVAVTHNNEYKICIELTPIDKNKCSEEDSSYKYKLNQAKLYANTRVSKDKEALEAVLEWMNMNDIKGYSSDLIIDNDDKIIPIQREREVVQAAPLHINLAPAAGYFDYIDENDDIPF